MAVAQQGYSAEVDLYLVVAGVRYPVSQVGPSSAILEEPHELPQTDDAKIVIVIDGRAKEYPVFLTGVSNGERCARFF